MSNVGKGTAINVDVFGAADRNDWDVENSVRFPAIRVGDEISLAFLPRQWELVAQYTDPFGRKFTSACRLSTNSFSVGHEHPEFVARHQQWELDEQNRIGPSTGTPR